MEKRLLKPVACTRPNPTLSPMASISMLDCSSATDPLDWTRTEWIERFQAEGIKRVHAETAWGELHRRLNPAWQSAPGLPENVRATAGALRWRIALPSVARAMESADGSTRKFLLRLSDGEMVETVLMRFSGRSTACLSTQAGCAMGCVFCATGQSGFRRHLRAAEIVTQAIHVARTLAGEGERVRNIVLMGQGEPLHNYEATMRALEILTDERGMALAAERITLSTVGLVPGIRRMAEEGRRCSLAVSLHGATDEERAALVPVAKRWPLAELMKACGDYTALTGRKIFFEWTLIDGVNDSPHTAHALARLLADQRAHVNLIPLNPTAGFGGDPAGSGSVRQFQLVLRGHGIPSTVRQRRGIDIAAGCGQLAGARS